MSESIKLLTEETTAYYQYIGDHRPDSEDLNHMRNDEIIEEFGRLVKSIANEIQNIAT